MDSCKAKVPENKMSSLNERDGNVLAGLLLRITEQLAEELHPHRKLTSVVRLNSRLDDELGFDSLSRVELIHRVEKKFSVVLPEHALTIAATPADLLRIVLDARAAGKVSQGETGGAKDFDFNLASSVADNVDEEPAAASTLVEALKWHVSKHPDRPHIFLYGDSDDPEEITYGRMLGEARKFAGGLQKSGLKPGDTVAIMLPTSKDYLFSFIGILLCGAIPVPVYPPANLYQLEDHIKRHIGILANAQVKILVTLPEATNVASLLKAHVDSLQSVISPNDLGAGDYLCIEMPTKAEDIAFLQYTSGSTGQPKGVILTHANLLANIRAMGVAAQVDSTDVFVSWLPLYHDMGLIGAWMASLYFAVPLVLMSPLSFLAHPVRWLRTISRHRGTISGAPNFAYEICLTKLAPEALEGIDLSSLRFMFNGAEPVRPDTLCQFAEKFARYGLRPEVLAPVYGLAEVGVALAFPPPERPPLIEKVQREALISAGRAIPADKDDEKIVQFVACGQPLPDYQIRIVDDSGRELPDRHQGRLQFRGPSTTRGYYRNNEATCRLLSDGWLDSGDLGYIAKGDVYLTGRVKDIIIRAGRNIYPHEVEEALARVEGVRKGCAALFGVTDNASGPEKLIAVVETRERTALAKEQLGNKLHSLISHILGMPADHVVLAPPHSILKTSSGKIRRSAVKELYLSGKLTEGPKKAWRQFASLALHSLRPRLKNLRNQFYKVCFALYVNSLFWLLAPLVWLTVVIAPHAAQARPIMRYMAGKFLKWALMPVQVEGLENLPGDRPCVIVANHASYLDGIVVASLLSVDYGFVAKRELQSQFLPRIFLQKIETEFVERYDKQRGIADARQTTTTVKQGLSLVYFPEGTFTRIPGLLPFHMGAFVAAAEADAPVVPLIIRGTRSILRDTSRFPYRGKIHVTIRPPILPEGQEWSAALKLRREAREEVLRYLGEPDLAGGNSLL